MKIFRIAFIIPAIIVITLVWVFFAFFLDSILKSALIFTGQAIFSAKVEVGSFRTSFKSFSININSLKIGDKDKEFQNLADIDNINFKLRFIPLLSKKFIIDNMSVDGFKWSTTRKTSAKLPPKKQKKNEEQGMFSKALDSAKEKAQSEFNQFSAVQNFNEIKKQAENFSIEGAMDFAGIKSADIVKKSYEDISQRYEGYIKSVEGMDIEKQIASIKVLADNISKTNIKTVDDAAKLQNNLKELSAQKSQLETQFNDLKKMQEDISKDIKTSKDGAKDINALINGDIADILSKLSIPSLGSNESIRMLFGNIWVERINTIVYYMSLIRHYMPQKKAGAQANAEPAPLRLKGRDIVFPLKGVLPKLWIANISISANSGGEGKDENPIFYKGSVQNITSDQKVIGKNTSFEIVSDDKKQIVKISGVFDRLKEIPSDTITFFAQGVGASMLGIPDSAYTPSFNNAKMMVKADFSLIGSDFISDLNLNLYSFSYDAQSS
ncbi:MAG: TIGR03545 family protein, partial [Elusimicrobiota bacterium]|nr:TIGR03545 family protein [Elusimicrobiota bacterium]